MLASRLDAVAVFAHRCCRPSYSLTHIPRTNERGEPESAARSAWREPETTERGARRNHLTRHRSARSSFVRRSAHTRSGLSNTGVAGTKDTDDIDSDSAMGAGTLQPEDITPAKRHESDNILSVIMQFLSIGGSSVPADTTEKADMLEKLKEMESDNVKMRKDLENNRVIMESMEHQHAQQLHTAQKQTNDRVEVLQRGVRAREKDFREAMAHLQNELEREKSQVAALRRKAVEDETKLGKVYTMAVSAMAQEVSRDFPDDIVKNEFSKFFQGDLFSWCADLCATHITYQDATAEKLRNIGIINGSQTYQQAPRHLQLDMNMSDGRGAFVLLQAALANTLCDTFLNNPYFLAEERRDLKEFEKKLFRGSRTAAIDWRIRTVECLEAVAAWNPTLSVRKAESFEHEFEFLLQDIDQAAREDLASLFTDFANLALRLWKIRTNICVLGMPQLADATFQLGSRHMDGEPAVVSSLGQQLHGRPIGVVMRPLIISEPVMPDGEQQQVVWSKALVWVSGQR